MGLGSIYSPRTWAFSVLFHVDRLHRILWNSIKLYSSWIGVSRPFTYSLASVYSEVIKMYIIFYVTCIFYPVYFNTFYGKLNFCKMARFAHLSVVFRYAAQTHVHQSACLLRATSTKELLLCKSKFSVLWAMPTFILLVLLVGMLGVQNLSVWYISHTHLQEMCPAAKILLSVLAVWLTTWLSLYIVATHLLLVEHPKYDS